MIKLWFFIVFGNQLVSDATLNEKVYFYVKGSYLHVKSESLNDSIKIVSHVHLKYNEEIFTDGNKYCRFVKNKEGMAVYMGDKSGSILMTNGRRNKDFKDRD